MRPLNEKEAKIMIKKIRARNIPETRAKRLTRRTLQVSGAKADSTTTMDSYYVHFINDILSCVRNGHTDYCFHDYHIRDLLRFEPHLKIVYIEKDKCFKVWL